MLALSLPAAVTADHDKYQYKFPCKPGDACHVTTLTHPNSAFDFDPRGSAGLGEIHAVSEGTFQGSFSDSDICNETGGLGIYAQVIDVHGRLLRYAHLSATDDIDVGDRVLQGDRIGIEGDT